MIRWVCVVLVVAVGIVNGSRIEAQPQFPFLIFDTQQPTRLAVDAVGNIYVVDPGNHRVQVFDAAGLLLFSIGGFGTSPGRFDTPTDVAVASDGSIYVADSGNARVQKFDVTGHFVLSFGAAGREPGQFFNGITALALDSAGYIYVGSTFQLQKFSPTGTLLHVFPFGGIVPSALAIDLAGNLIFYEKDNGTIDKRDPTGILLARFASPGCDLTTGFGCVDPDGTGPLELGDGELGIGGADALAVDLFGNIYVADSRNSRIQKFSADGAFLWKFGSPGVAPGQFGDAESVGPQGLAVDDAGRIYVADTENNRIQVFEDAGVLTITNVAVVEGHTGTSAAVFTVTLAPASTSIVTVDYTTADESAQASTDYTPTQGTLTFAPGDTTRTLTVLVQGDTVIESDERFVVLLSNPTNATLATTQGVGEIVNDDVPRLSIADAQQVEGNTQDTTLVFTLSLSAPVAVPVTVMWSTADGTATAGSDYVPATQATATFLPGTTTTTIGVRIRADRGNEPDEYFTIILSNPTNATLTTAQGTGGILNDDIPHISIADAQRLEGNTQDTTLVLTLRLSAPVAVPVTVIWSTADGTATAGSDYVPATQATATFLPGTTTTTIGVRIRADRANEPDEFFFVILSQAVNAVLAQSQAIGTIRNDDRAFADLAVAVVGDRATVVEGGRINFRVEVTNRGPDASQDFSISGWTTLYGSIIDVTWMDGAFSCTATSWVFNCVARSGDIALAPGQSVTISIIVRAPTLPTFPRPVTPQAGLFAMAAFRTPPDLIFSNNWAHTTVIITTRP